MAVYIVLGICGLFSTTAYLRGEKLQDNQAIRIGTAINIMLYLAYRYCSREAFISNPKNPDWAKARIWGSPTKERFILWKGSWF